MSRYVRQPFSPLPVAGRQARREVSDEFRIYKLEVIIWVYEIGG